MSVSRLQTLVDDTKRRKGRWLLTPNHEIEYRSLGAEEEFSVKGPIIAAEPGRLVFAVTEKTANQKTVTRLAQIDGAWSVNSKNQILFEVKKSSGRPDTLTFKSGWRLNDRYEIVYAYKETTLKTRRKLDRELIFSGQWDLSETKRLVFLIGGEERSKLRFRGAFQTPSILAKNGEIRYQLGVEGTGGRQTSRSLVFFGKWKVSRRFGLSFELETGEKKARVLNFGVQWHFNPSDVITASLRSSKGEPLGMEVTFSRDFSKNGEFFLRALRSSEETRAEAGVRWSG